jgi:hypothetical protein
MARSGMPGSNSMISLFAEFKRVKYSRYESAGFLMMSGAPLSPALGNVESCGGRMLII